MTYEPYGDGGMRITVEAKNAKGEKRKWGYGRCSMAYRPMTGDTTTEETAVEVIDVRTNKIMNKTGRAGERDPQRALRGRKHDP
jgi:hypothetical protein